jgi:hypothetical protein
MRTALIAIASAAAVIIVVALFVFLRSPGTPAEHATSTPSGLPVSGSVPVTGGFTGGSGTSTPGITVAVRGGGTPIAVRDFLKATTTTEDPQNKGTYYLAGSLGYCLPDGSCPSGAPADDFKVVYYAGPQSFTIALTKEPIGLARTDAEAFLEQSLGVGQDQLCALSYYVGTDVHVNAFYAGKNLGFSFCPGATALPQ